MAVATDLATSEVLVGPAQPIFAVSEFPPDFVRSTYDLDPTADRFLLLRPMTDRVASISVLTHWTPAGGTGR